MKDESHTVTNSCGCVFCDLDLVPVHPAAGELVACTNPALRSDTLASLTAERGRYAKALKRIAEWKKYSGGSRSYDNSPDDPIVEAYENGANDMVDTLAPIATAALRADQSVERGM